MLVNLGQGVVNVSHLQVKGDAFSPADDAGLRLANSTEQRAAPPGLRGIILRNGACTPAADQPSRKRWCPRQELNLDVSARRAPA